MQKIKEVAYSRRAVGRKYLELKENVANNKLFRPADAVCLKREDTVAVVSCKFEDYDISRRDGCRFGTTPP